MILNGSFKNFLSEILLLMYRNTTDFYILIVYPATLLNSFIISNGSNWVETSLYSLYRVSCHLQIVTVVPLHIQI